MSRLLSLSLLAWLAALTGTAWSAELLRNADFSQGRQAWWSAGAPWSVQDAQACVQIDKPGSNPWDVIFGQSRIPLKQGRSYTLMFTASARQPTWIRPLTQLDAAPWTAYFAQTMWLTPQAQRFRTVFTLQAPDDERAGFQFQLGGRAATTVCISQVSLSENSPEPVASAAGAAPGGPGARRVRLNQVGYLPVAPKRATMASASTVSLPWQLRNAKGQVVVEGQTRVFGLNRASGELVHLADFSAYTTPGANYQLSIGTDTSHPFRIGHDVYRRLRADALQVLAQMRSRAGGWTDGRDTDQFAVNGGIALWTLQHLAERLLHRSGGSRGDSLPDLLAETRRQMDFLLNLQVPPGRQLSVPLGAQPTAENALRLDLIDAGGMVHHKAQIDRTQAAVGRTPAQHLHYPSTAATLVLAATAAQCGRLWQRLDPAYARRCLDAGERAWDAAVRHPDVFAYNQFAGGGPFDNQDVSDEFYWAAAELYATTADPYYLETLQKSPRFLTAPLARRNESGVVLQSDLGLAGTITLATVLSDLPAQQVQSARERVVSIARAYLAQIEDEGYGVPFSVDQYPWGSNAHILNRALVLGVAHDLTHDPAFFFGAGEAVNYLLGRNPLGQSYVSGYGARPVQHLLLHARAGSVTPAGLLAGGPNSVNFSDPVAARMKGQCTGQTCWVDDAGAWTMNEAAVNWNASLLWVVSLLDDGLR